jgi:hypothetical protein
MTPKFFYEEIACKNMQKFDSQRQNIRLAYNAFASASHLGEYLLRVTGARFVSLDALHAHVVARCPQFGIARDVANGARDLAYSRPTGKAANLKQLDREGEQEALEPSASAPPTTVEKGRIVVKLDDGTTVGAFKTLELLIMFWKREFPSELA